MTDRARSALTLHVGRQVKHLRVASGESQSELGAILGLTFQQIQKYEKGQNAVSIEKLWLLAEHYHVDIAHFFDGFDSASRSVRTQVDNGSDTLDNNRLRLEIGRSLLELTSPRLLREMLFLVRSITELDDVAAPVNQDAGAGQHTAQAAE
jgi:transcriptional regulator with XRE-family HTH domain